MLFEKNKFSIEFDDADGKILSLHTGGAEHRAARSQPLVTVSLIDQGARRTITTESFSGFAAERLPDGVIFRYEGVGGVQFNLVAAVRLDETGAEFTLTYSNHTGCCVEWILYPGLLFRNALKEGYRVFLPMLEGVELADFARRDMHFPYQVLHYPNGGTEGLYPGCAPVQFTAYYNGKTGIYIGSHDTQFRFKQIDCEHTDEDLLFVNRLYPGTAESDFSAGYPVRVECYAGGFYEAADIYRNFSGRAVYSHRLYIPYRGL